MSTPPFSTCYRSEVAHVQHVHPERLGEFAHAHALILHGQVLPSADDPQTGHVLGSDRALHCNGLCNCQAGRQAV